MSAVIVALKLADKIPAGAYDYIGVDKGTLALITQGLPVKLAIGDFDSVTEEEMKTIQAYAKEVIALNPIKDDTDSEAALKEALKRGYDEVIFLGATGGRADHAFINMRLAEQHPGRVILLDEQNRMQAYSEGSYRIKKENYAYIGFFTEDTAEISLENFKYPLEHRTISNKDLYNVSNEITGDAGILHVHQGTVLVIQSKDEV